MRLQIGEQRFRASHFQKPVLRAEAEAQGLGETDFHPDRDLTCAVSCVETWIQRRISEKWTVAYRLLPDAQGAAVIAELRVMPYDENAVRPGQWRGGILSKPKIPAGGITARLLRKIPLGNYQQFAGECLRQLEVHLSDFSQERGFSPNPRRRRSKPGPKGRPEIFYARVAEIYAKAISSGARKPTLRVAKRLRLDSRRATAAVHQARVRGYLSPGQQGRPQGAMTKKAVILLRQSR